MSNTYVEKRKAEALEKIANSLDHPCKETCSGWKQGFEKGADRLAQVTKERDRLDQLCGEYANIDDKLAAARARITALTAALEQLRPVCEACEEPAVVQYDSQGEGRYWLCARKDGDHDDDHYCGTVVYKLPELQSPDAALATVKQAMEALELINNRCHQSVEGDRIIAHGALDALRAVFGGVA